MYNQVQSPQFAQLAEQLSIQLDANKPTDPFVPVEIIVPNRDTAHWLSLYLAESDGIAGNYEFRLPSEWLWQRIREVRPQLPDMLPSDPGPMAWSIYSLLKDRDTLARFPALKNWLDCQSGPPGLHSWHLSRQISIVFDQYQVYRPQMLQAWEKGEAKNGAAAWQARLWKLLTDEWDGLTDNELRTHRGELYFEILEKYKTKTGGGQQPIYIFNAGLIPPPISRLFLEIGKTSEVFHFIISSCNFARTLMEDQIRNEVFKSFGQEQLEQFDFVGEFRDTHPDLVGHESVTPGAFNNHNLAKIRQSIINNRPVPTLKEADNSIVIKSCHSPLREVEALHQYLLELFSSRGDLTPDDILVVTPDIQRYEPFIRAVFGTREEGLPDIPYHLAGGPGSPSRINQAFLHLLKLPESRFSKEEVIEFLQHTAIRDHFQLSDSDISLVENWFSENRVVWGLDGQHRSEFRQPADEQQTWKHAMRRGWLGQLMAGEPGTVSGDVLLYAGISSSDEKELWARIHHILKILSDCIYRSRQELTPQEWEAVLAGWARQFFSQEPAYEDEFQGLLNVIQQTVREMVTGNVNYAVSFSLVCNSLITKIENSSGAPSFFTRGMLVNSMVPVRSLPFKVIALLGLNDDHFPRKPLKPEFDLMESEKKPGERDRKNEDRNLFLESIMAAREVHYSSYIGKNQQDNEPIPPSPILDEWIRIVADCFQKKSGDIEHFERLNEFSSETYSGKYHLLAKQMRSSRKVRGIDVDDSLPLPDNLNGGTISLDQLDMFFRNPAGTFFRDQLDIFLKNLESNEEEEFAIDGLNSHILFQHIFSWYLHGKDKNEISELLLLSGFLPEGWPGEKRLREHFARAVQAVDQIRDKGHEPGLTDIKIDIQLSSNKIEGDIYSFSREGMLDIHISGASGRIMLSSWLRHLLLCINYCDPAFNSDILYEVKKGAGTWSRFTYEPDALEILDKLVGVFKDGMRGPVNLYIDSAFEYAVNLEKSESAARNKALTKWGGEFNAYPERSNRYLELLLGKEAEADMDELISCSDRLFGPMMKNMRSEP